MPKVGERRLSPIKQQGITKREKVLLFAISLVALLYISVQFVIIPLANRYIDGMNERDYLSNEKAVVDMEIAGKHATIEANRAAGERFEAIKQEYPLLVPNEHVHTILTNLCFNNGLTTSSLNMSTPRGNNSDDADTQLFTIINASMSVTGSYNSLLRLLDEVDSRQYIRITDMVFNINQNPEESEENNISLSFELTFINP